MFELIASTGTIVNSQITTSIHNTIVEVLQLALLGVTTLAGMALKTWLSSLNSGWKQTVATRLVKYAEQRFVSNQDKLDYVAKTMHDHFPRLSQDEIHQLLEEAVNNLTSIPLATQQVSVVAPVSSSVSSPSSISQG